MVFYNQNDCSIMSKNGDDTTLKEQSPKQYYTVSTHTVATKYDGRQKIHLMGSYIIYQLRVVNLSCQIHVHVCYHPGRK